jgi:hypothetical protein
VLQIGEKWTIQTGEKWTNQIGEKWTKSVGVDTQSISEMSLVNISTKKRLRG